MPDSDSKELTHVSGGDCCNSLGLAAGHHPKTIWQDGDNESLRSLRGNMAVLKPGDSITIPPLRVHEESCATAAKHTFKRLGVPSRLRIRMLKGGKAWTSQQYELRLEGGLTLTGSTDGEGILKHWIPPSARSGELYFKTGKRLFPLAIGDLDPPNTSRGAQSRLRGLGLPGGPVSEAWTPKAREALRSFQRLNDLEPTGELDHKTASKLADLFNIKSFGTFKEAKDDGKADALSAPAAFEPAEPHPDEASEPPKRVEPPKDTADTPAALRRLDRIREVARSSSDDEAANTIEILESWDFSI